MIILDSTLREGEQTPDVSFTIEDKIQLVKLLDEFGIEMIEIGHPSVSPSVYKATKLISKENLNSELIAHVRAIKTDIDKALTLDIDRIAIFLGISEIHLKEKLKYSKDYALERIKFCIEYAKDHGVKVRFTPEDSTRTGIDYLIDVCKTAIESGADRISIADTVGVSIPSKFIKLVSRIKKEINVPIDVHCHNDFGLALANAISAIDAGADCVHATVNGLGERCGIVDLATIALIFSELYKKKSNYKLNMIQEISSFVEQISGVILSPHTPITGVNAFSHKSGVHTDGILKNPATYEPYSPTIIGRKRRICIDKYTGKLAVKQKLEEYGINVDSEELLSIVKGIKILGDKQRSIHDSDILEIYEDITGKGGMIIPKSIEAMVNLHLSSNVYTTNIVRKISMTRGVESIYELAGEEDIKIHVSVPTIPKLNNLIEEIRAISGIDSTHTKIILKKFGTNNGYSS